MKDFRRNRYSSWSTFTCLVLVLKSAPNDDFLLAIILSNQCTTYPIIAKDFFYRASYWQINLLEVLYNYSLTFAVADLAILI